MAILLSQSQGVCQQYLVWQGESRCEWNQGAKGRVQTFLWLYARSRGASGIDHKMAQGQATTIFHVPKVGGGGGGGGGGGLEVNWAGD